MVQQTQIRLRNLLLYVFLNGMLTIGCRNESEEIKKYERTHELPAEIVRDIKMQHTDSGRVTMKLNAPLVYSYAASKPRKVLPKGIEVQFFSLDGKPETKLTAGYAINYEAEGKTEVRINVVVVNEKGERLETQHLTWDENSKSIFTEEFVTINTGEEILFGDGLVSNQEFTKYRIKNIKGTIQVKE